MIELTYFRNVPENSVGSCGIMEIFDRNTFKSMQAVFTSSIIITPSTGARRKIELINDDLPAPVLPTTLIFSFGFTLNDSPRKTGSLSIE